jgi:hypothetical protein
MNEEEEEEEVQWKRRRRGAAAAAAAVDKGWRREEEEEDPAAILSHGGLKSCCPRQGSSDQRPADDPSHYGRPKRLSTTTPLAACPLEGRKEGCALCGGFGVRRERASERRREGERETVVPLSLAADAGPISHH